MEKINWSKDISVGVVEIDDQHRQLIGIINDLTEAKQQNRDTEVISEMLS